jgi:hypothetical protein
VSTMQRIHARTTIVVDRATADVLRIEAKKVLMFGHDLFEDFLDFCPEAQQSLALRYCNASELITTLGWDPEKVDATTTTFEVPLTEDLINLLALRRHDLMYTNLDHLDGVGSNETIDPDLLADITTNRQAAQTLHHLFGVYAKATRED